MKTKVSSNNGRNWISKKSHKSILIEMENSLSDGRWGYPEKNTRDTYHAVMVSITRLRIYWAPY